MIPTQRDIFRMVSLRGSSALHTIDPAGDIDDSVVRRVLAGLDIDVSRPSRELERHLASVPVLTDADLQGSVLTALTAVIEDNAGLSAGDLCALPVAGGGDEDVRLDALALTDGFQQEYRQTVDSWLKVRLTDGADQAAIYEDALRSGHIVHLAAHRRQILLEPDAVRNLQQAVVVFPAQWRPARGHRPGGRPGDDDDPRPIAVSPTTTAISEARAKSAAAAAKISTAESVQRKAHRLYTQWRLRQLAADRRSTLQLDDAYFEELQRSLTDEGRALIAGSLEGDTPHTLDEFFETLGVDGAIDEANQLCRQIRLWEEEETRTLPPGPAPETERERPLLNAIGWGELVVARERLLGYDAREIAHIENVMPGENKLREHERQRTVEDVTETETISETESERDLQTTDRSEIQSEAEKTIEEEFAVDAGVNTSGRYGLTKVETSLDASFQQSSTEARSSSQQIAHEVVSRAVERTFTRIRELRRLTVTEQIRELNRHSLDNAADNGADGGADTPDDVSGIYLWVEKQLEVQLRHYGTRMLVEFYLPEPALSLLEQDTSRGPAPRKPADFTLAPNEITAANYLCLAALFEARDIEPPPPLSIDVGYAWKSTPSENVNANTAEDTVGAMIAVPADYRPVDAHALISAHPSNAQHVDVWMAVAGAEIVHVAGEDFGQGAITVSPSLSWPGGVPVSIRAHGHHDKTLVAHLRLRCERTAKALTTWQLRTWEELRNGHEARMQDYRSAMQEYTLRESFTGPEMGAPAEENRRVEREELKKWAVKAMRMEPFDFSAVETVGDFQEVDPRQGSRQSLVAGLFEEGFEWDQSSYFLYPYFWARRDTWKLRRAAGAVDHRHAAFLRAGSARFIVPVTPGYEERILHYLETDGDETARLGQPAEGHVAADSPFAELWIELMVERRAGTSRGSGTLKVTNGSATVEINSPLWNAGERDVGRELFIDARLYLIAAVDGPKLLQLSEAYDGVDNEAASYASGSVPYGAPWMLRAPTSLVLLAGSRPDLSALNE